MGILAARFGLVEGLNWGWDKDRGHGGKEDELLHNLPPTLVLEKMWYRVTRSYLIQ